VGIGGGLMGMVLGNSSTQLKISIIADMKEAEQQLNAFTTQIENVTKSAKSSSENLKGAIDKWIVGLTAVTAALVAATAKFTQSTLQIGGDFELSIVKLGGVAQASSEEMSMLEEKARELGETLPITASQAAGAMYSLASAGAKVNEIMNAINATTQLSISQNYDLGQSTDLMVATMRSFNMDFAEGMRVADVFNNTIRGSMMNMEKFSSAMVYVAKPAHDLGLSLEQTAAMMGVLADSGMRGEQVGTAMRALFTALMDLSDEGAAALARLGVTLTDSFGEMRDVTEVFEDLARSGMTAADALAIFDKRSFGAALTITGNIDRLRSFTTEVSRTGTTSKLVGDQMQTFNMRLEGLKSAIEEGFLVAYEGLQHASKKTVDSLRDMVLTFNDWARETKVFEQILSRLIFGLNGTVKGADAFREALQRINVEAVAQTVERVVRGVRQLAEGLYTLVSRIPWVKLYTFMEIFITPLIWAKIGALLLGFVATIGGLVGAGAKLVFWIKQFHGTLMHGIPFTQKAKESLVQMGLGAADASHGVEKLNLSGTNAQKSINAVGNASAYAAPAVSSLGAVSGGASVGVNALAMSNNAVIAGTAGMSGVVQNASTALQNVSLSATKGAISLENLTMVADAVNDGIRRVAASTTAMNSVLDGTGGKAFTEMSLGSQKLAINVAAMNGKLQRAKDELYSMMRAGSISADSFKTLGIHAMNLGIEQDKAAAALEKTNAAMAKTVHAANAAAGAEAKMGAAVTITTQALYKETMGLVANGNSRKAIDIQLANHLRANRITQAQYDQMVASLDRLNGAMMRLSEGYSISTGKLMVWLKYMTAKKVSIDVINAALARMHALQLINTEQLNLLGAMAEVAGLKTLILANGVSLTTKALAALKLAGLAVMPWLKMLGMMIVSVAAFSAAWKVVKWPFELMSKLKDRIEAANKAMREQQKEAMDAAYYASDYKKAIEGCNEALDRLPEKLKKAAKAERAQKDVLYELKEVVGSYEHIHAPLLKVLERLDDVAQEGYAAKIEGDLKKWQDEVDSLTSSYDDLQTVQSVGGMLTERDTEEAASILKRIEELQEKIRQNSIGALADEAEHYLDALPTIEKAVAGCVESFNSLDKEHQDHVTRVQKQIERTKELWEENFNGSETRALAAMIKQTLDATGGSFENTAKEIGSQWNGYIMAIASQGERAVEDFKRKVFAEGLLD
jgi:TP901 family phage tail tape measure protein